MRTFPVICAGVIWTVGLFATSSIYADSVELINGDVLHGTVITLDGTQLKLRTELLGELSIARAKVAVIRFGDTARTTPSEVSRTSPALLREDVLQQLRSQAATGRNPRMSPEDVLQQLRSQPLDAAAVKQIHAAFPLLAAPEAQKYFDETLSGLMKGSVGIEDLRRDAIKARDQVKQLQDELRQDLGPQADVLNLYLGILDGFIRETEPGQTPKPAPSKPAPSKSAPPKSAPPKRDEATKN